MANIKLRAFNEISTQTAVFENGYSSQLFQLSLLPMSRARYFACSTASRTWPCRTYWVLMGLGDLQMCMTKHMLGLKCINFPSLFPMFEFYEVLLKGVGVIGKGPSGPFPQCLL